MNKEDEIIGAKAPIIRTAAQTAVLVSLLTVGSKILGFIREMIMASYFGTSFVVDAYVMAQAIPSMIFAGVLAAMATAYMPLFSEHMEKEGPKAGNIFTSQILLIVFIATAASSIIGIVFARPFVSIFAHGFTGQTAALTVFFVRVTFSYTLFSATSSILEAFLQYKRIFIPQVIVGYSQNIIVILVIMLSAFTKVRFLAFGLLIAYAVRLFCVWILAKKRGFSFNMAASADNTEGMKGNGVGYESLREIARKIVPLAIPVFIGSSISQIGLLVDRFLASGLPEGSVAALNYANVLNGMVSVMGLSILSSMIYPRLTQASAAIDTENFNRILQKGMNVIFMIALPFSLGAMIYAHQIVQIVFERGAFDPTATTFTGDPYICYSMGLLFSGISGLLIQSYYAMQDTKSPMVYGIICVIIDIILNFVLVRYMAHSGLALSTSIGSIFNTIFLYCSFRKKYPNIRPIQSWTKIGKIAISAVIAVGGSFLAYQFIILPMAHIIYMRMMQVGIAVLIAVIVYLIMLRVFKIDELSIIKEVFNR